VSDNLNIIQISSSAFIATDVTSTDNGNYVSVGIIDKWVLVVASVIH
jgi:hypothetical protein